MYALVVMAGCCAQSLLNQWGVAAASMYALVVMAGCCYAPTCSFVRLFVCSVGVYSYTRVQDCQTPQRRVSTLFPVRILTPDS
jgi:hypothetical protein